MSVIIWYGTVLPVQPSGWICCHCSWALGFEDKGEPEGQEKMNPLCLCAAFQRSVAQLLQHYLWLGIPSWYLKRVQDLKCKWPRESQGGYREWWRKRRGPQYWHPFMWSVVRNAAVTAQQCVLCLRRLCLFVLGQYLVQLSLKSFKEVCGFLCSFYIHLYILCVTVGLWTLEETSFKVYILESRVNKTVPGTEALNISWPNYSAGSFVP